MNWNGRSSIGQERGVARLIDAAAGARAPLPLSRFSDDALAGFFAGAGRTLEHLPLREIIASGIEALRCSLAIAEPSGQSAVMQGPMPLAAFAQTRPATQFESKLTRLAKTLSPYFFDERPLPYERGSSTRTAQERKPDQAGTSLFQMLSSLFRLMRDLFLGR